MSTVKSIGWFSTGRDQAACDLLSTVYDAVRRGEIAGQLDFVFCNREAGEAPESDRFLALAAGCHVPLVCLSSRRFWRERGAGQPYAGDVTPPWRFEYDREVLHLLDGFSQELVVMAGYMMITSPLLCQRLTMINLHPALPDGPKGTWQEVIWQLIGQRARTSGVMMHLVTPELDRGPAIAYCGYSLRGGELERMWAQADNAPPKGLQASQGEGLPLFQAIRQRGLSREFPLIVSTLQAYCHGRFRIEAGRILDERGQPRPPVDLTAEVEAALQGAPLP